MKKYFLIIISFVAANIFGQNLDSLFNVYMNMHGENRQDVAVQSAEEGVKCATALVFDIKRNIENFNPKQKSVLSALASRPSTDTSFVTKSGLFRVHFYKSGSNAPGYDLNELSIAIDSSYNYEVNILGYPPPPFDSGNSSISNNPDQLYDIYITNLSFNFYGYTDTDEDLGDSKYTSFIVIDNDFSTYYTKGIDAARVTVAHELHHAIQMGNYIFRSEDQYYYELTSTSMEEFVFDDVNDYYDQLRSFMLNPRRSFPFNNGYNLAIWNIFLSQRFDKDIIKRTWELMPQKRALNSIADAIAERGKNFKEEFAQFGLWLYFTGSRAVPGKFFEEAANYPLVKPLMSMEFMKPESSMDVSSEPVSTNILLFTTENGGFVDTFTAVISNCDLNSAVNRTSNTIDFKYRLSNSPAQGFRKVLDGYYSLIESQSEFLLTEANVFNNSPVNNGGIISREVAYVYPQPFRYSKYNFLYMPAPKENNGVAELYVYSTDMNLVYNGNTRILNFDNIVAQWNPFDNNGNKLASGIYFYVLKSGDKIIKGKFAVLND